VLGRRRQPFELSPLGATSPRQPAFWIAAAASAAFCAEPSDLKKPAGRVTPVAWFGQ
jgi:hypothetical protein